MAQQWYPQGTRPQVLINWQSFVNQGINAAWQGAFTDAVINAYTRWMTIAGVDLRFQFFGYTTKTAADPGELVIQMDPQFGGGAVPRLASTLGQYNQLTIIFHRKNAANGTPWNFVPYNAVPASSTCRRSSCTSLVTVSGSTISRIRTTRCFSPTVTFKSSDRSRATSPRSRPSIPTSPRTDCASFVRWTAVPAGRWRPMNSLPIITIKRAQP